MSRVCPEDRELVGAWTAELAARGMAPSSIGRLSKRVRGFAEVTSHGLLKATRNDFAAFAAARAARAKGGHPDPLDVVLHSESLCQTVLAMRQFYAWLADRRLVELRNTPIAGLRLPSARNVRDRRLVHARGTDHLLHIHGPPRERAIVWLLAHGISPREVVQLRPGDVDLENRLVHLPRRRVPLTPNAVEILRPWVESRQLYGGCWLFAGRRGKATTAAVRGAVYRLACQAGQKRVSAARYRDVFIARALRRGISLDCVPDILGFPLPARLRSYLVAPSYQRLHRELRRISRRWKRWLG